MTTAIRGAEDLKLLCRELVMLCDRYLEVRNFPELECEASEIRGEIMRLYGEISGRSGKAPGFSPRKIYS